jgi:hypothetical protein
VGEPRGHGRPDLRPHALQELAVQQVDPPEVLQGVRVEKLLLDLEVDRLVQAFALSIQLPATAIPSSW